MKAVLLCLLVSPAIASEPVSDEYKALVDARFLAQERWIREAILAQEEKAKVALQSAEKAIDKSERASESRFQSVNEFRAALSDQTGTFITRQEALAWFMAVAAFAAWLQRKQGK